MTQSEGSHSKYLHSVLADGSRNFRYRPRVRALLGLPTSEGVKVRFGFPFSSMMAFTYSHPQFREESYLPDEAPGNLARGITYVEDEFKTPPVHPGPGVQRARPAQLVPEKKPRFTDGRVDQALNKAESSQASQSVDRQLASPPKPATQDAQRPEITDYLPAPFHTSPLNLPDVAARKAVAESPKREEHNVIQIPGLSKNDTAQPAQIQLPSNPANEQSVRAQAESSRSKEPRRILPAIQSSPSSQISVFPAQTSSALPYPKPQTKGIQSWERIDEDIEQPALDTAFPPLPSLKVQPKDKSTSPKLSLSSVESEFKPDQTPAQVQHELPAPAQPVTVLWRGVEARPRNLAFWERRYLHHYRLRLLR